MRVEVSSLCRCKEEFRFPSSKAVAVVGKVQSALVQKHVRTCVIKINF